MEKKKLVAYFSCSGVTKGIAKALADAAKADLYEIRPQMPYTEEDLDWKNKNSRSTLEMNDTSSRPEIATRVKNMEQYDVIYLGFPIWWYVAPTIINTFVESYDLSGKIIVPFCTSGGSDAGKTVEVLQTLCSTEVTWKPCIRLTGASEKELNKVLLG